MFRLKFVLYYWSSETKGNANKICGFSLKYLALRNKSWLEAYIDCLVVGWWMSSTKYFMYIRKKHKFINILKHIKRNSTNSKLDNVLEFGDISTFGPLFQWATTVNIHHIWNIHLTVWYITKHYSSSSHITDNGHLVLKSNTLSLLTYHRLKCRQIHLNTYNYQNILIKLLNIETYM